VNVFEAGIIALAVCFATGLPGDWARRRTSGAMAGLIQVVTVAGIVGAIATDATAGWLHGFWPVAVIVIAIVLGEVLADQLATRLWGQPRRPRRPDSDQVDLGRGHRDRHRVPSERELIITTAGLRPLPASKIYEAWLINRDGPARPACCPPHTAARRSRCSPPG
jgi:hypothetical protein